jgi:hypothetical protein
MTANFKAERALWAGGARFVAGVDEVGRGPLAGPVCVAAVIFPAGAKPLRGVDDSKKLNRAQREELAPLIVARALAVAVAFAPPEEIDRVNIRQATLRAMARALAGLAVRPDFALIDGRDTPEGLIHRGGLHRGQSRARQVDGAARHAFSRLWFRGSCGVWNARAPRGVDDARALSRASRELSFHACGSSLTRTYKVLKSVNISHAADRAKLRRASAVMANATFTLRRHKRRVGGARR